MSSEADQASPRENHTAWEHSLAYEFFDVARGDAFTAEVTARVDCEIVEISIWCYCPPIVTGVLVGDRPIFLPERAIRLADLIKFGGAIGKGHAWLRGQDVVVSGVLPPQEDCCRSVADKVIEQVHVMVQYRRPRQAFTWPQAAPGFAPLDRGVDDRFVQRKVRVSGDPGDCEPMN